MTRIDKERLDAIALGKTDTNEMLYTPKRIVAADLATAA